MTREGIRSHNTKVNLKTRNLEIKKENYEKNLTQVRKQ